MPASDDWKAWYAAEARGDAGRAALREAIARRPEGDPAVRRALATGGVASFPHTTLHDSAEPLARVATSILAVGFPRVLALGVLHGGAMGEPWRSVAARAATDPDAYERLAGAWLDEGPAATPYGEVPAGPAPRFGPRVRVDSAVLALEFSLDLFLAALAAAAAARGVPVPAVTRAFVGPTVGPDGVDRVAGEVADALRPLLGRGTALVATGDLAHVGHGYSPPESVRSLPADPDALARRLEPRVHDLLAATYAGRAREAEAIAREIGSDQRHVAPVLARLVAAGSEPRVLSFALSDYGPILGRPAPCVVGSVLYTAAAP